MELADIYARYWSDQSDQARNAEAQRATLSNMILILAGVGLGFVTRDGLGKASLIVTPALTALGVLGAVASRKLYERYQFHISQAEEFSRLLGLELGIPSHNELLRSIRRELEARSPVLHRVRLSYLWTSLHVLIALSGVILTIVVMTSSA